ncbi:MAG: hypothetical protein AAF950_05910 [Pseudomonadota bacterium]
MSGDIDLKQNLETWCESYVRAFEAFDVQAIGQHWDFPAVITSGDRQIVLADAATFDANTEKLVSFYKRQDVKTVIRSIKDVLSMGAQTAAMRVHDKMLTRDGQTIVEWRSAYVLRRSNARWRAIFADANGELKAWADRGTPLGS